MKAKDFEFNGKNLSDFGFIVANFGDKGLEIIDGSEIKFNTISSFSGSVHHLVSTVYESCLETTIQIAKYSCSTGVQEITAIEHREISSWLNRKRFFKFKILNEEHIDLYYMASIVSIGRIELDGCLMGLELNIVTNSPHALKEPKTFNIHIRKKYTWEKYSVVNGNEKGKSMGEYVTSYSRDFYPDDGIKNSYYFVYVNEELIDTATINDISHEEGYIYPYTEIVVNESGDLNIYNAIEDRNTYIANCVAGEIITMDYPIISSSISSHNIQNDFNYNFFRIANTFEDSRNDLTISLPCTIKATYSPIVKIGL